MSIFLVVIHHNPDCGTSRNVLESIHASGYEPTVIDYLTVGWTRPQLLALFAAAWITTLTEPGVRISMDGRGRCMDNIFIERLCRSLKQEAIYLEELTDGFKAHRVIGDWLVFYNTERPHSALERRTPREAYWHGRDNKSAA